MAAFVSAAPETVPSILAELDAAFHSGKTLDVEWRKDQLRNLWRMLDENASVFRDAVFNDIGKPRVQTQALEIGMVKNDTLHALASLDDWLAPETVPVPIPFENWSPVMHRRPKGTCLIIGTWNYPITLTLLPFIGAIACGNTVALKPSELAPHTATLLAELFPKYLDQDCFKVINGDRIIAKKLLEYPFGHILFTGGTEIGREVMKAAAKHLTPLTLELGGRNSVVVTENANVELAAKRTAWGKFAIAGQTCFAPNQVLVHENVYDAFVEALSKAQQEFYGNEVEASKVGQIVNQAHWRRIMALLSSTKGEIVFGGTGDEATRYIAPTVVQNVSEDDPLLHTEVFGPILPLVHYRTDDEGRRLLRKLSPGALGFYVFSEDMEQANEILTWTLAGTASINDVMGQIAPTGMPFGGIRGSGMGSYRGKASIDTFSHQQPVVTVPTLPEFEAMLGWRYPHMESSATVEFVRENLEGKA